LAQQRNPVLKERVVVTVGLTCGQMKNRNFTDYISGLTRIKGKVKGVKYRTKRIDQPAGNFQFSFSSEDGDRTVISWKQGIEQVWTNRWFTPNACNYCDDVFAECADIDLMDAWLPEYSVNHEGTSLVLVRSPIVQMIIDKAGTVRLDPIPIEKVVQSQIGVITIKRHHLAHRLYLDQTNGRRMPKKRVSPSESKSMAVRMDVKSNDKMTGLVRKLWLENADAILLEKRMHFHMIQILYRKRLIRLISYKRRNH
jgi:coenzyme F420 hydrogenase subunit beta